MSDSRPDQATVDAWLAGSLGDGERTGVEMWIDENPDALLVGDEDDSIDESLLKGITREQELDPELTAVIDHVTGLPEQIGSPGKDDWKEILAPSENLDLLGTLGGYDVIEVVASGGMGIVFKARDPELQRFAALKVLAPDLAANATARARFLREARAAANLEHDNILPIYHVHDEGVPWFAMRFAEGGTLQDRLDGGDRISLDQLKSITHQTSSALAAAHDSGLIHRDIKPANLLFDKDGDRLWVCDFGIARSTDDPGLTYPGAIAGTPQFMSPEQADGTVELDGRSDLYSLGAVLYRCAVGKHYIEGDTTASVLDKLQSSSTSIPIPSSKSFPNWLRRLLTSLLAPDREDRPNDAHTVVQAVEVEFSPRPRHTERRNRRIANALASGIGIAALALGLLQISAVQSAANHLLSLRHEQAYLIAGKIGSFPSLEKVVSVAESGDEILLPVDFSIAADNLQIGPGKALVFRSASETKRPQITTDLAGVRGFVSESQLSFSGIDFVIHAKENGDGIIMMRGGDLFIEDCSFLARREVERSYDDTRSRTIQLFEGSNVTIRQSKFDLQHGIVATVHHGGSRVSIFDSKITAFFGLNLWVREKTDQEIVLEMERCSLSAEYLVKQTVLGNEMPRFSCRMVENEFRLMHSVGWVQTNYDDRMNDRFFWNDRDSILLTGQPVILVGHFHHQLASRGVRLPLVPKPTEEEKGKSR